jgi:hypothetical protein
MRLSAVVACVALAACARPAPRQPSWPDAPLQLRDESDREQETDRLWVLPHGAERDRVRARIAEAIALRINDALADESPLVVETLVFQLAALWQADPTTVGRGLAPHVELLRTLRATFARSGTIEPALATLVLLAEVDGAHRADYLAELDEVVRFSDELAEAELGPEATRAQPIALLQPTVLALPLPWLVDRYVGLLVDRQRVVSAALTQQGASIQLVRAHHDILATSYWIAIALARSGRTDEIHRRLSGVRGIGESRELAIRAEIVAEQPTDEAYYELARLLRADDKYGDPAAALAVCQAGLRRHPGSAALLAAAAGDAAALGRIDQPIALYEAAIRAEQGNLDNALALRLGKLYAERIARLAFGGRPAAATSAWRRLALTTREVSGRTQPRVWAQITANAETALGKGLLSQGHFLDAERALVASLDRAPSIDAYETLATIHYKTGRLGSAFRYATDGLALLGDTRGDRARRARLERIAGDVARSAGRPKEAAGLYLDAMRSWASLGEDRDLPRPVRAERKLDAGRAVWFLGDAERATDLILASVASDAANGAHAAAAAAFLLQVGGYTDALDVVHRALTTTGVSDFYRAYMCLWVTAEAQRRGEPRDGLAYEYLASRNGELWYERLAAAATGRLELAALEAVATTGPRQAELAFYTVTLGLDPSLSPEAARRLLERVVDARLVMDAEYDLARRYLARP